MALWNRRKAEEAERQQFIDATPQIERVYKRYASGYPRLLSKSAERTLRTEFTRVSNMKASARADWMVLWHEPTFRYVKDVEIRKTIGSTHETKRGEILYIVPESQESFDPLALRAVNGDGEEAGFISMRDKEARRASWEALINGQIAVVIAKRNRKLDAAMFVYVG